MYQYVGLDNSQAWSSFANTLEGSKLTAVSATIAYLKHLNVTYAIEESDYVDRDYRTTHAQLYSRQFRCLPQLCKRYHFFSGTGSPPTHISDSLPPGDSYCGYLVKRPLPWAPLGRTILSAYSNGACHIEAATITCAPTFVPHIDGRPYPVRGVPYTQQDSVALSCAETSIWIAARIMTKLHKHQLVVPPMVTSPATIGFAPFGSTFPTRGLSQSQVNHALNSLGFHPMFYDKSRYPKDGVEWNLIRMVYPYIASGIPCILAVPRHAVTACGFIVEEKNVSDKSNPSPTSIADWITSLVCQDDQKGPYRVMPGNEALYCRMNDNSYRDFTIAPSPSWHWHTIEQVEAVTVTLPDKVYLAAEGAELTVRTFLSKQMPPKYLSHLDTLRSSGSEHSGRVRNAILSNDEGGIVYSLRCRKSVDLRNDVRSSKVNSKVRKLLTDTPLPRYVWIAEFTTRDAFITHTNGPIVLGQLIMDATGTRNSASLLFVHVMGFATSFVNNGESGFHPTSTTVDVIDDQPFRVDGIPGWTS
jgi:hypothetical protein